MKILVTGGAGYVGIELTRQLLDRGDKITILDNFMYGYEPVLHLMRNSNLEVIKKDIRNLNASDLKGYDVIFHLAGISGYPACEANPHSAQIINVDATRQMVKYIKNSKQLMIYASTTSFYGKKAFDCDETTEVAPVSLYGKTKYEAEKIIMSRKNSIALRFATIFGTSAKMRNDLLVNDFVYKAINERSVMIFDGKSRRTFVHILDAVQGYLFALDNRRAVTDGVYNVGDESMNYSKYDIVKSINKFIDFEIIDSSLNDLDVRSFNVSFKKIKSLGYGVKYSLSDGIQELIKLYQFYRQYMPYKVI
ncbi:MAG: epimerase [Elusimicrobia bacterium HGW-Elusimicrobia-2]|nr:MAG: epimerase [Elusimicrobia bacterium HGW-Elusimicrobia-2]